MKNRITLCLLSAVLSVSLVMPSVVWASGEDTSDFQSLEGEFDLEESFEETQADPRADPRAGPGAGVFSAGRGD